MPDLSPHFAADGTHSFRVRVYYEDTDTGGIVYYANYLKFAERARTEVLRDLGISQSALIAETGVAFAVRRCEADYLAPAKLDDELEVRTSLRALGHASLDLAQTLWRVADGRELVRLIVRLAVINKDGRPTRLPAPVAAAFARLDRKPGEAAPPAATHELPTTAHKKRA